MAILQYYELTGLEQIYLEDSYVLDIVISRESISFIVDAVLKKHHPEYQKPPPDKQYCYRLGEIKFPNPINIDWLERNNTPNVDIDGGLDFGNIDLFSKRGDTYDLVGGWGHVKISSRPVCFKLFGPHLGLPEKPRFMEFHQHDT